MNRFRGEDALVKEIRPAFFCLAADGKLRLGMGRRCGSLAAKTWSCGRAHERLVPGRLPFLARKAPIRQRGLEMPGARGQRHRRNGRNATMFLLNLALPENATGKWLRVSLGDCAALQDLSIVSWLGATRLGATKF